MRISNKYDGFVILSITSPMGLDSYESANPSWNIKNYFCPLSALQNATTNNIFVVDIVVVVVVVCVCVCVCEGGCVCVCVFFCCYFFVFCIFFFRGGGTFVLGLGYFVCEFWGVGALFCHFVILFGGQEKTKTYSPVVIENILKNRNPDSWFLHLY